MTVGLDEREAAAGRRVHRVDQRGELQGHGALPADIEIRGGDEDRVAREEPLARGPGKQERDALVPAGQEMVPQVAPRRGGDDERARHQFASPSLRSTANMKVASESPSRGSSAGDHPSAWKENCAQVSPRTGWFSE